MTQDLESKLEGIRLNNAQSPLQLEVQDIVNDASGGYEHGAAGFIQDVQMHGCVSGLVGALISYADTTAFYARHKDEIVKGLTTQMEEFGASNPSDMFGDKWDKSDPFCSDTTNQNLLAWYAFEMTARGLAFYMFDNAEDVDICDAWEDIL